MLKKLLDARAKRSQSALLKAGMELLNQNPLASLSDIASHAGVGRTTLYRQYESREKLIQAIALDCLQTIDTVTESIEREAQSAIDAFDRLFRYTMPLTQEFCFLFKLEKMLADDPKILKIQQQQQKELLELIEYGKQEGEIDQNLPNSWLINLLEALFFLGWQQQNEHQCSPQEAAKYAFLTFKSGVSIRH